MLMPHTVLRVAPVVHGRSLWAHRVNHGSVVMQAFLEISAVFGFD